MVADCGGRSFCCGWSRRVIGRSPAASSNDLSQRVSELIDVLGSVERSGADAHRALRRGAEGTMNVGGAVQAGPNGDVEAGVEHAGDVDGLHRMTETQRAHAAC